MVDNIMNDDKTIADGGEGMILAGSYHSPIVYRDHSRRSI